MKWSSTVSDQQDLETALGGCIASIKQSMGENPIDLAVIFVSPHFASQHEYVAEAIHQKLAPGMLFGCSAGGVIGDNREVEHRPGLSITAAHLPGVELTPFHLEGDNLPDADASPSKWEEVLNVSADGDPRFLLLLDPFTFPADSFILGMDYAFSRCVKVGGMASAGQQPGENGLFLGDQVHRSGAIGLAMKGNIVVDTIVAQGCRPVGKLMSITESKRNLLLELDKRRPLDVLQELFSASNQRDQQLMQNSLFLGIVMDDFLDDPHQGDFLVRNVIGMDSKTGTMAIGELLREGQRVQFHLRDAVTSAEDLSVLLTQYAAEERVTESQGALLFSCLGRGEYLYGQPDHDTGLFKDKLGSLPLGGFFCNGEIGPVSGTTYVHGYTSSFGIFRPIENT